MTCPLAEFLILKMQSYYHFEKKPAATSQGPESPYRKANGFNIALDPAKVESQNAPHVRRG